MIKVNATTCYELMNQIFEELKRNDISVGIYDKTDNNYCGDHFDSENHGGLTYRYNVVIDFEKHDDIVHGKTVRDIESRRYYINGEIDRLKKELDRLL